MGILYQIAFKTLLMLYWLFHVGPTHLQVTSRNRDDDVIKYKHFQRYWPFVLGIHRSALNSPHKRQWRGTLIFSLICVWINGWVNNREAADLRRHRAHYDVNIMEALCTLEIIVKWKHLLTHSDNTWLTMNTFINACCVYKRIKCW